jgi:rRNA-processing protein FCF1
MLLNDGMQPAAVVAGLDEMIRRLQWATTTSNQWSEARNSYLVVLEALDPSLRTWFEDDDGAGAGLYSDHHKMIREMSGYTARPDPLIQGEIDRQVRVLESLKRSLQALEHLRARHGQPVVIDTNVLMHFQRPDKVTWAEVVGSGQVRIILPILVIDELDNKKYTGSDRMSNRANQALAVLRGYRKDLGPGRAATLPDGTTLEIFLDEPGHQRLANYDEELRTRCMLLQRSLERKVTLVTGDFGAELRAEAHGLEPVTMPEKFSKDAERRQMGADDDTSQ